MFALLASSLVEADTWPASTHNKLQQFGFTVHDSKAWSPLELDSMAELLQYLPRSLKLIQTNTKITLRRNNGHSGFYHQDENSNIINIKPGALHDINRQLLHYILQRYDQINKVSLSSSWRQLSGWQRRPWGYVANNQDPRAYATRSGLNNPQEDFITTALAYILPQSSTVENSIKCRIPGKYNFMRQHFSGYHSLLEQGDIQCRSMERGFLDDVEFLDFVSGKPLDMGPITPETVSGFELLYATPGTGDASEIAGHLLLRIKLKNNPRAEQSGRENPKDLVVSFLANTVAGSSTTVPPTAVNTKQCKRNWFNLVDDGAKDFNAFQSIMQSLRGLSGGFLTVMDRQPLGLAIKKYTIEEDRDLLRYELVLTQEQKHKLLQRLYLAKKNYSARYYFFKQNCASVLVKVIGQGIGVEEIADFNPIVSPPNALVGLFLRLGLAKPVYPSFHSYRKKAYLAQELIKAKFPHMTTQSSNLGRPTIYGLFNDTEEKRLTALADVDDLASEQEKRLSEYYKLLSLVQESEMAYSSKELVCEDYTSEVVAKARDIQSQLLLNGLHTPEENTLNTHSQLAKSYIKEEQNGFQQGIRHTKLFSHSVALTHFHSEEEDINGLQLQGALFKQEMGSHSGIAMQRGGFVRLADASVNLSLDSEESSVLSWEITALHIRKFKQRLNYVPSYLSHAGRLGLGLSLLEIEGNNIEDVRHGTVLGGELMFNLISSKEHRNFAFLTLGLDLHRHLEPDHSYTRIMLPLHVETLLSFGHKHRIQWRNALDYKRTLSQQADTEIRLVSNLSYRLGDANNYRKSSMLLSIGSQYNSSQTHSGARKRYVQSSISLELNWW